MVYYRENLNQVLLDKIDVVVQTMDVNIFEWNETAQYHELNIDYFMYNLTNEKVVFDGVVWN